MKLFFRSMACSVAAVLWLLILSTPLMAQGSAKDAIAVGSASTTPGATISLPVYVRDVAGTPLGVDLPPGNRIQAFSFTLSYTPATAVVAVDFTRAGITSSLTPLFETVIHSGNTITYIGLFDEASALIPFTLNAPSPGNQVGKVTVQIDLSAPPGTVITLAWDATLTELLNQAASITETTGEETLTLVDGSITIYSSHGVPGFSQSGVLLCTLLLAASGLLLMRKRSSA